ncbi:MAG TPA: hypothetical protein P5080_03475 [Candidatus Paceibacterota bacterium]|nr:hypothetical protein [Candidatus Pacearchaeota archaeon]HRZ51095.1 hypothetical protein [Candidatus Paceibacterota bacterium]HSA36746.1 hypothetical protein [Candidatus Paceibacterota bacterium]
MDLAQESKLLEQAFKAFKAGNDKKMRDKAKALAYIPEAPNYNLAIMFYSHLNSPGNEFSPKEQFWGECVLGQLYFIAKDETIDRDLIVKASSEAQDHFDRAYVISKSMPKSDTKAVEMLKARYLEADKKIRGVNMLFRL